MKTEVLNEIKFANTVIMRLVVSLLCTLFLFTAYYFEAAYISQVIIFVLAMVNMRIVLIDGFDALCKIRPNAASLVFVSTFSALLHGFVVLGNKNYFAYAALTLAFFACGEHLEEKNFGRISKTHFYIDRICAAVLPTALVLFVVTVIFNLFAGEGMYETMSRAFSVTALFCPCIISFVCPLISFVCSKKVTDNGIFVKNAETLTKLGNVKEVICDLRGIVADEEYSLYDIFSVNYDKTTLLSVSAAIETHFDHSFAHACADAAIKLGMEIPRCENTFEICGRGVGGVVYGDKYLLGNKKLFKEKKISIPEAVAKADFSGKIPLYVAKNGEFVGVLLFYHRKKSDVDFVASEISRLGKRSVLLAADEYSYAKGNFDILLSEREKVLQEFKKGAKIKAMVISQKPIANADVVATTFPSEKADVVLGNGGMSAVLFLLALGKAIYTAMQKSVLVSVLFAAFFSIASAFGIVTSPLVSGIITALPLAFVFSAARLGLPEITASEEDEMFGKINYTMHIDGMNCAHCSARVKTALESIKGVSAKISLEEKTARIKCPAKTTAEELAKAVADIGFTVVSTERV